MSSSSSPEQDKTSTKKQSEEETSSSIVPSFIRSMSWGTIVAYTLLVGVSLSYAYSSYKTAHDAKMKEVKLRERINQLNRLRATPGGRFQYNA